MDLEVNVNEIYLKFEYTLQTLGLPQSSASSWCNPQADTDFLIIR